VFWVPGTSARRRDKNSTAEVDEKAENIENAERRYSTRIDFDLTRELSRDYFEHLGAQSKPYYKALGRLLLEQGIPFWEIRPTPPDPELLTLPTSRTPWKPLAIVAGLVFLALAGLAAGNR
jgi:hypothetical protein